MRNAILLAASLVVGLLIGEGVLRLALDEVNYLRPVLLPHRVLGHVIEPGSSGHDDWGYRNREVPQHADIVAIGDSQTYGVSTTADESWPAVLAKLSGKTVYNMGLGGRGPPDYLYVLKNEAVRLSPRIALVGLYLGNDLLRSYEDAVGLAPSAVRLQNEGGRSGGGLRSWLSHNSMLYQVVKLEAHQLIEGLRYEESVASLQVGQFAFSDPRLRTVFDVDKRLQVLDQSIEQNRIGLERMLEIAAETYGEAGRLAVACVIVVIPTKASVYWPFARDTLAQPGQGAMARLVEQEGLVHDRLVGFLAQQGIPYVDALPGLQEAAKEDALYPAGTDGHPTGVGYRVIALAVHRRLAELHLLD